MVEGNFSVLLWSKTVILSLYSELDQAEQKGHNGGGGIRGAQGRVGDGHV